MSMNFSVQSNIRNYDVLIESDPDFIEQLAQSPQACFVVDENVWNLYSSTLLKDLPTSDVIVLPINEDRKSLETVQELYDQFVTLSAKRNLKLISFGGGILQDITGFAASTIYRGIHWIYIPTTLLAQADSCIGSKTSLNYHGYKNLIGTFFPPAQIYIYPPFLKTQSDPDFYSGLGEVIKLHLMGGELNFRDLIQHIPSIMSRDPDALLQAIRVSLDVKLSYMDGDEFDIGRRNLLNYGHDFGHALESTSNFAVPHGQAVVFGMLAANFVARNRGLLNEMLATEIARNLILPSLKVLPPVHSIEPEVIIDAMKKDKKRTGDLLALIMMQNNFDFIRINDLTPVEVASALTESKAMLNL
ncbi:MAG: 3-dehydroquinate synthase [Anaerolineales bacterium]|nr:3-dehydroquinate synthase [Anaerolineales bacterium]